MTLPLVSQFSDFINGLQCFDCGFHRVSKKEFSFKGNYVTNVILASEQMFLQTIVELRLKFHRY